MCALRVPKVCVVKHVHVHELTIDLRVTGRGGDCDLYASTTFVRPTAVRSTWISAGIGGDNIAVRSDHPDWNRGASVMYIGGCCFGCVVAVQWLNCLAAARCSDKCWTPRVNFP